MLDIRPVKKRLREKYKSIRKSTPPGDKNRNDIKITNKVLNLWRYRDAEMILTYVSTDIEVDTREIITQSLQKGKTVAVPKCIDGTRDMEFYAIKGFDDLAVGAFGVMEPVAEKCELLTSLENSLCIVPALSFDYKGYRLGYGKGYYDRFLSTFTGEIVGLCYTSCMYKDILPHGKYDKKVPMIITENNIISTEQQH